MKFLLTVILCVHIMGCIWFLTARIDGFTPDSWVVRRGILDSGVEDQYLNSVYWAFTTVTTVGYGDIAALTQIEMVVAMCWMIFGVGFYSFTIGSLSSFLSTIDTSDSLLNEKLAATNEFAKETGISERCKKKITLVIKYNTLKAGSVWNDKHQLFNELPKDLRYEVALSMYSGVAQELPFFKDKDKAFVVFVMPLLKPFAVVNNEFLYREGEFPCEVFFIVKGRVNLVLGQTDIAYKSFLKGSYIGEIELIVPNSRLDNCQAFGESEFLLMQKEDFSSFLNEFPSEARAIKQTAKEKLKRNGKAKQELLALLKLKTEFGNLKVLAGRQNFLKEDGEEDSDCSDKEEQ
jgi:hyperpolarization activated cyclic nucleotide-gated potassium channel 1